MSKPNQTFDISKIEIIPIAQIKPNPTNPRTITDDKFRKLVESIRTFPQMLTIRPIIIDENNITLGGNMRLKAAIAADLTELPIIRANKLTDEQKKQFIIKDNIGYGEWDWELLYDQWDKSELTEWGLDLKRYETPEDIKSHLADRFIVPPFTILDTRQGDWIKRKQIWNDYLKEFGHRRII